MSPDEAAFLKAISDKPADETARQAYADWLTDNDDPRAEFVKLSADFLRCVRGLTEQRRSAPADWLKVTDTLFGRFGILCFTNAGEGIESGTVTALRVVASDAVAVGQALAEIDTDKASLEIAAEHAGVIVSVNVHPGDRIPIGYPLLTYLSLQTTLATVTPIHTPPISPHTPSVPRGPLQAFIQNLEDRREELRTAAPAQISAMIGQLSAAARMVFGLSAVVGAQNQAQNNRGWTGTVFHLPTLMKGAGLSNEATTQEFLDIHIEMLRVLLAKHGQPTGFAEQPALPGAE